MRLPFLKVQQDALVRARMMARLLGVPEAHGIGLAVSLFAWGLEMAADGDLSGQIPDEHPWEVVAAAVGWDGDPEKLYRAFIRVGFIATSEVELGFDRVKGLDMYAEAMALPGKRSEAGKRGAAKRWQTDGKAIANLRQPDGKPVANDGQTQTQTQTQRLLSEDVGSKPPTPKNLPLIYSKPSKPDENWDDEDFEAWVQFRRQESRYLAEKRMNHRKRSEWWTQCFMTPGVTVHALKEGFYRFGEDKHWEGADPPYPFAAFVSQWTKYVRLEEVANAGAA